MKNLRVEGVISSLDSGRRSNTIAIVMKTQLLPVTIFLLAIGAGALGVSIPPDDDNKTENTSEGQARSYPHSSPEECARPCVAGATPKTCYYHFDVEAYGTLTEACKFCRSNGTVRLRDDCQCIIGDGYEMSSLIVANRMLPGPSIMVCRHDYVIVDVVNRAPGRGITIHWHGLYQEGYQYYDGVPQVTQCPITQGATFRYQFRANNPGTHFWHAHTGLQKADGLNGPLIVRESKSQEPNSDLWDHDDLENVIFITDFLHDSADDHYPGTLNRRSGQYPDSFLINGYGQWTNPETGNSTNDLIPVFSVQKGGRYRFRLINACAMVCPVLLSVEGHKLQVIATDGESVEPAVVDSITSLSAERYDFIINTKNKPEKDYWIQVRGLGRCARTQMQTLAILRYENSKGLLSATRIPTYGSGIQSGLVLNPLNVQCNGDDRPTNTLCITNLKNSRHVPKRITSSEPDIKVYLPINFYDYSPEVVFKPETYRRFLVAGGTETIGLMANISYTSAPSPLLTQREDIPDDYICSSTNLPARCQPNTPCICTHVEDIPMGALIEIVLVDEAQIPGMSHPFHLHGYSFYVIGQGCAPSYNITSISVDIAKELDLAGRMKRHLKRPPAKDTYAVPNNGFTIIRFIANNPGYWLFHCHFLYHLVAGMSSVFHVGQNSDLPPIPKDFPKCGDFMSGINWRR